MRTQGSPAELERRRLLAVRRILEGYPTEEVAEFLEVDPRTIQRWFAQFRVHGEEGLLARSVPGRPPPSSRPRRRRSSVAGWMRTRPSTGSPPNCGVPLAW